MKIIEDNLTDVESHFKNSYIDLLKLEPESYAIIVVSDGKSYSGFAAKDSHDAAVMLDQLHEDLEEAGLLEEIMFTPEGE